MIAVVYSGSKNACWKLWQEDKPMLETHTPSVNPCFNDTDQVLALLNKNTTLINYAECIKKIYVFSAGASAKEKQSDLKAALSQFFVNSKIKVKDDLHGAAIAACHNKTGIVGILGSGSNCAYFNGKKPEKNDYGLGYILADEGSANYFGKILLKHFLEGNIPADLQTKLVAQYNLERPAILERVYKKPRAERYFSSFLDFYSENRQHEYIQQLLTNGFDKYFRNYIIPTLEKHPAENIHFVGNVAGNFPEELQAVASKYDINIKSIHQEPIHDILNYYIN